MKTARCLILSRDDELTGLLQLTLREYGFKARLVDNLSLLGPMSAAGFSLAWMIDLDGLKQGVTRISSLARRVAPDSKIVFISSSFTLDLAQECLRERATALLVKPVQIPRLVQCIGTFFQEPELLDREDCIPQSTEPIHDGDLPKKLSEESLLSMTRFDCPICKAEFEALRFKNWMFPVSEMDTDFCPVCPHGIVPELYSITVCPECFYADHSGRFERFFGTPKERKMFLVEANLENRRKFAGGMYFSGRRNFFEALTSFELAGNHCAEIRRSEWDSYYGDLMLKTSWLCRRMGMHLQEQEAQIRALQHYMEIYRPYLTIGSEFPKKAEILARLPIGKRPLRDRAITVTGFLAAEISRRLGIVEQSQFYFAEVFNQPFLKSFPTLLQHIQKARRILDDA